MIKKLTSLALCLALLICAPGTGAFAAGQTYAGKTVILYTGNVRGDVSVYAQVKAAKDAYEAAGADVILADAGNYLQGTAAANTDRGLSVYNLMDAAGYDVAAMGLAEFGYTDATTGYLYHGNYTRYYTQAELQNGAQALTYAQNRDGTVTAQRAEKSPATFQTVASNVTANGDTYAFETFATVTTKGELTVAFYGVTDPAVAGLVQDGFLAVTPPTAAGLPACDVSVCLSNAGLSGDGYGDILIDAPAGGELLVGAAAIDNATGEIGYESVDLSARDAAVEALAAAAEERADRVVGTSEVILNGADSAGWNGETNLGDLVTDALVWYATNYIDGMDPALPVVAIQNGGNCDNFIYTGEITETDLLRALPFSPMGVGVVQVTGAQLLETLESATQRADCAAFAQVSGLSYTLDTAEDYDGGAAYGSFYRADSINRVTITQVGDLPFDADATYALVCDNFLIGGNDTYYTLAEARESGAQYLNNGTGVKTRDVVALYIREVLGGTVSRRYAAAQGRITVLKSRFSDVAADAYYFDAVNWAVERGITGGTSDTTFSPDALCTRAQAVTFLWRAAGSPEPSAAEQPFADVAPDAYYHKAVLWATQSGITSGTGEGVFSPDAAVSRAQVVTFLLRCAGESAQTDTVPFADVAADAYYHDAVNWAVERGITGGTSDTTFSPDAPCTRAQIVTFLYRWFGV